MNRHMWLPLLAFVPIVGCQTTSPSPSGSAGAVSGPADIVSIPAAVPSASGASGPSGGSGGPSGSASIVAVAATTGADTASAHADSGSAAIADSTDSTRGLPAEMFGCTSDKDCKGVSTGGCCPIGRLVAVNSGKADDYKKATPCDKIRPICPMIRVRETRVARCDAAHHRCEMVAP